jgi:hypothetical protein
MIGRLLKFKKNDNVPHWITDSKLVFTQDVTVFILEDGLKIEPTYVNKQIIKEPVCKQER